MTLPTVRQYMNRFVDVVSPDMDIYEAVEFLLQKRVTGAPVVDARGRLVGIITETDCLKLLSLGDNAGVAKGTVEHFMTTEVQTIPPNMDIYYAAGLFLKVTFRRFPVVEDARVVGVVTRFDILRGIRRGLD